jgi:hypothetical protein
LIATLTIFAATPSAVSTMFTIYGEVIRKTTGGPVRLVVLEIA